MVPVETALWGGFEAVEEESEPEEEEEEEEEPYPGDDMAEIPPSDGFETAGLATPSGLSSVPAGLETPDHIELRKETRRYILFYSFELV
jgi:splicing factor 3B subunit 2